jgi:hypothetical protein
MTETELLNINTVEIPLGEPMSQKAAEDYVRQLSPIRNNKDGRIVKIPVQVIWKILSHRGFDISLIIKNIPDLYRFSVLAWSESEILKEGHKSHPNIKAYHNYINKFKYNENEYFIRFTVTEEKVKPGKVGRNLIHSAAVSRIAINKNGDSLQRIRLVDPGEANLSPFIDLKLIHFLDSVKHTICDLKPARQKPRFPYPRQSPR